MLAFLITIILYLYVSVFFLEQCIPPKHLPHGHVTYNHGNTFIDGDEISFNCDMGYYPEHRLPIATCRNNDWFPTLNCVSTGKHHLDPFYIFLTIGEQYTFHPIHLPFPNLAYSPPVAQLKFSSGFLCFLEIINVAPFPKQ